MKQLKKIDWVYVIVPLGILAVIWTIAAFTGMWPWKENPYNSYTLQACSWLEGRLDLGRDYPWLELAIYGGKYYVSFPPFPSVLLLPFVMIFGNNTPDHFIVLASTVVGAVYAVKLYRNIMKTTLRADFYVFYLYLASGLLFVSVNGYVWFLAQSLCFTLSLMALYYATEGKGGLSLAFWACAVGCRPMVAIYVPLLLYLLQRKWREQNPESTWLVLFCKKWTGGIAAAVIAIFYMVLNYARFGSVLEFGHNYLPEFTRTSTGQFHLSYLAENIKHLFRMPWGDGKGNALHFFTSNGMAFWLVTPLFLTVGAAWIYGIVKKRKECLPVLIFLPVLVIFHVLFLCCHKTLGGWHFGNRYLLDLLPYLIAGFLLWKPRSRQFDRWNIPLFMLGFALNLIGTVATYNYWISE